MVSEAVATQQWERGSHPLLACVESVDAALDAATGALAVGTDPAWLPAHDQGVLLEGLQRIEQRVAALKLATLSAVGGPDGIATTTGARSPSDWLAHRLHLAARRTGAEARLTDRLVHCPVLRAAMLDGVASTDHARAVLDCLDTLPAGVVAEQKITQAEEILTGYCREFTPAQVAHLGRRILELVAPDDADALEAERLERAEREALRRTRVSSKRIGEGLVRVTADVPALHASILHTVLDAIANPARDHLTDRPVDDGQRVSADQRRGQAFCTLLETLDTSDLPHRHGSAVSVAVMIDEDRLRDELRSAGLCSTSGGVDVSLGEARRLMCDAGIWPAVMGGDSVVLDAGRTRRFHTGPMRKAMEIAHPTCQVVPEPVEGPRAAPSPPPGATAITRTPGRRAEAPVRRTEPCSAVTTTAALTTPATRHAGPPTVSPPSTGGRRPTCSTPSPARPQDTRTDVERSRRSDTMPQLSWTAILEKGWPADDAADGCRVLPADGGVAGVQRVLRDAYVERP